VTDLEIQFSANACDGCPNLTGTSVIKSLETDNCALVSRELNHSKSQIIQSSNKVTESLDLSSCLTSL